MLSVSIFICKHMNTMFFVSMLYLGKCMNMWSGTYRMCVCVCVCVCVCECEKVWGNACISMHFIEWMCLVQLFSCVWLFVTPWTAAHQASRSITNFWSLLKLMSIELVMPSNHLILCRPLLLLPSIFCSIRVISNESVLELVNRHMGSEGGSMDQGQSLGIVRCR